MGDLPDLANRDYVQRVNRAIDHVTRHLAQPLPLEEIARVAAFSPFHFHRVFRAMVGETLLEFIRRTRLERALFLMSHDRRSLTDIALEVGFNSSSDFSRSFKARFGVSPRKFDLAKWRATHSEQLGVVPRASDERFTVKLRELPARRVAYLRVFRPYEAGNAKRGVMKMVAWAQARGLSGGQWLGYQWEEADLVPLDKCRYDIGVEVPEGVALDDEVGEQRFPAMTVVELAMKGDVALETRAFDWLYGVWLPKSGYSPAHQPAFEAFDGLPYAHGDEHFELRIQLAVER